MDATNGRRSTLIDQASRFIDRMEAVLRLTEGEQDEAVPPDIVTIKIESLKKRLSPAEMDNLLEELEPGLSDALTGMNLPIISASVGTRLRLQGNLLHCADKFYANEHHPFLRFGNDDASAIGQLVLLFILRTAGERHQFAVLRRLQFTGEHPELRGYKQYCWGTRALINVSDLRRQVHVVPDPTNREGLFVLNRFV